MSADPEPRLFRVTLCTLRFCKVEVSATDAHQARTVGEAMAREARHDFTTAPAACRVEILRRDNPADPESPCHWQEVRVLRA